MDKKKCPECEFVNGNVIEGLDFFDKDLLIYQNKGFAAYYSNNPVTDGHIIILPKNHHFRMLEFSPKEWKEFGELLQNIGVAGSMRSFNLAALSGIDFGKHLLIHLLPSGKEGYKLELEPKGKIDAKKKKELILYSNEAKSKMPIKGRTIMLKESTPRNKDIAFEDIMPGMPCLIHGKRHNCEFAPPKDAIPPIYEPKFIEIAKVDYVKDDDLVASVTIDGITRAYPIRFLDFHEIVNDSIGDTHFAVSYCPLCASSLVFNRKINPDKPPSRFGVSGFLYQSDLLMFDHESDSLWSQIEGECVYGNYLGKELDLIPFQMMKWKSWKSTYTEGKVLSIDTGFSRDYTHYPYGEYMTMERTIFPTKKKDEANRLHPKTMVYGLESEGVAKVYPEDYILDQKILHDTIGKTPIVITIDQAEGVLAFETTIDDKSLNFTRTDDGLLDKETNTKWNFLGEAVSGPKKGSKLTIRPDLLRMFYFAWVAFNPKVEVEIYQNIHERPTWKERLFSRFKKEEK